MPRRRVAGSASSGVLSRKRELPFPSSQSAEVNCRPAKGRSSATAVSADPSYIWPTALEPPCEQFHYAAQARAFLTRIDGIIDGIDVMTAMTIISEAGWDMSKWVTEHHFVSWLRLCPDNRISGNKIIGKGRLPTNNPISIALKIAASTLRKSNTYLGAQFRRFRTRLGAPVAIKAMAAKLARLLYRMVRYGMKYVDQGAKFYEAQHHTRQIKQLQWKAAHLGFKVVQAPAA